MEKEIARLIGEFYLDAQDKSLSLKDTYLSASEQLEALGILSIVLKNSEIIITLMRPGLLIGRRGDNIDKLSSYLSKQLGKKIHISLMKDKVIHHLYPFYYDLED